MRAWVAALVVLALLPWSVGAAEETVTLTVSVENQAGDPVAGATINASWSDGYTERTTASNGKAFVDVPARENVRIEVEHPEYVRNYPVTLTARSDRDVDVSVYRRSSLSLSVEDGDGPVPDAEVVAVKDGFTVAEGQTDAAGAFEAEDIEAGSYEVTVSKRGYYEETATVDVDNETSERVEVEQGSVVLEVNVTDDHYGDARPLAGVTVQVGSVATATTLDNGQTSARVPVNSELSVHASKDGYENATATVQVGEEPREIDLTMNRVPRLDLEATNQRVVAGERVVVEVTDEYGDPVEDATILVDGDEVGETDADGRYAPRVEDPGNHTIHARDASLSSNEVTVRAIDDSPTTTTTAATTTATTSTTTEAGEAGAELRDLTLGVGAVAVVLAALAALAWWRGP